MYALKRDGAIPDMILPLANDIFMFLPLTVDPTPGVNTWPKPGHALQVLIFISDKESDDILTFVGIINFLFGISTPVLLSITSFGLTPINAASAVLLICFGCSPVLVENCSEVPSSPPSI